MSDAGRSGRLCTLQSLALLPVVAFSLTFAAPGHAEPPASLVPEPWVFSAGEGEPPVTLEELRLHATTITEILEIASERVERLANEDQAPDLVAAIRQELNLTRRWNQHLATILMEVAEARRDLGARERKAAAEIAELTAMAEEARLELVALKRALRTERTQESSRPVQPSEHLQRQGSLLPNASGVDLGALARDLAGPHGDLDDARATLVHMQQAQREAAGDAAAVRTKIIDALHSLAAVGGDQIFKREVRGELSSEDVTAWAASMASRLHEEGLVAERLAETADPMARSAPLVEAMVMDGETLSRATVRAAPDSSSSRIAVLPPGGAVLVTGKVIDRHWYRIETSDGHHGFVSGYLIRRQSGAGKPGPATTDGANAIEPS